MKKVLLRFFSANNFGDDLFVKVVTDRYADQFTTFSNAANGDLAKINNLKIIRKSKAYFFIYKLISLVLRKRSTWFTRELKKNDLMLYVGGSIFQQSGDIKPWQKELDFYLQLPKPFYILGANVGPTSQKSEFYKILNSIFYQARDVCFRDLASFNDFKEIKQVRVASDIVFTLDTRHQKLEAGKYAIISIMDIQKKYGNSTNELYQTMIIKLTEKLIDKGLKVCYLSFWDGDGDKYAADLIHQKLRSEMKAGVRTAEYVGNIDDTLNLIAGCEYIVATRFHATILGLLFHKKILPVAYSDKTINTLQDIGFKGEIIDIRNLEKFDIDKFDFDAIPNTDITEQKILAEKQFQELDKVLTRRKK